MSKVTFLKFEINFDLKKLNNWVWYSRSVLTKACVAVTQRLPQYRKHRSKASTAVQLLKLRDHHHHRRRRHFSYSTLGICCDRLAVALNQKFGAIELPEFVVARLRFASVTFSQNNSNVIIMKIISCFLMFTLRFYIKSQFVSVSMHGLQNLLNMNPIYRCLCDILYYNPDSIFKFLIVEFEYVWPINYAKKNCYDSVIRSPI